MRDILPLFVGLALVCFCASSANAQCSLDRLALQPDPLNPGDRFGSVVVIDHGLAAIGAPRADSLGSNSGSVFVFDVETGGQLRWIRAIDGNQGDRFGSSLAVQGDLLLVGAPFDDAPATNAGSAYLINLSTGGLIRKFEPESTTTREFGAAVAIDDDWVVVGAPGDALAGPDSGAVYVHYRSSGFVRWELRPDSPQSGSRFGAAVALDGDRLVVGAPLQWMGDTPEVGAAYVFDLATGFQTESLVASDGSASDTFGRAVDIDGGRIVVGANGNGDDLSPIGRVYVYDTNTGDEVRILRASDGHPNDEFGASLRLDSNRLIVGAPRHRVGSQETGAAYVFDLATGAELARLVASDPLEGSRYGSVALDDADIVVGAPTRPDGGQAFTYRFFGIGTNYCQASPNSTGFPASMSACGRASLALNQLTLMAGPLPQQPYILYGGENALAVPFGNGTRCVGGTTVRLGNPMLPVAGLAQRTLDLGALGLGPGEFHFQCWFRDPAAGGSAFDLSDGLRITFQP